MQNTSIQNQANTGMRSIRKRQVKLRKRPLLKVKIPLEKTFQKLAIQQPLEKKNTSRALNGLSKMNLSLLDSYRRAVLTPEFVRDAKIPSLFPLATNSYHFKTTIPFTLNATGKAAILVNPWFLADSANSNSYILINNDVTLNLTGIGASAFTAVSMTSKATQADIAAYRLVSSSIHIYPEQSALSAQGYIAGGIATRAGEPDSYNVGTIGLGPFVGAAANASVLDQLLYYQKSQLGTQSGVRSIYLPFDPTFEMFTQLNSARLQNTFQKDQFFWNYYVNGGPALGNMVLEIYYNFELEPKQESLLQAMTTSKPTNEKVDSVNTFVATNPELISQSSSNLLGTAAQIDQAILSQRPVKIGFLDKTIDFMSNHSGDILNVLSGVAKFF